MSGYPAGASCFGDGAASWRELIGSGAVPVQRKKLPATRAPRYSCWAVLNGTQLLASQPLREDLREFLKQLEGWRARATDKKNSSTMTFNEAHLFFLFGEKQVVSHC